MKTLASNESLNMPDKMWEDIYSTLKNRRWGLPLIAVAAISLAGFAVWNSFPDSVKERMLTPATEKSQQAAEQKEEVPKKAIEPTPVEHPNNLNSAQVNSATSLRPDGKPYQNDTQEAQYLLQILGYDVGAPDGFEGPKTTFSLEEFQRKQSLPVSGAADEQTLRVLRLRAQKSFLRHDAND